MQTRNHVAVVIPAYNEADALPPFLAEIRTAFDEIGTPVTLIVIDDASTDGTGAAAAPFADVVRAPRNRGHGPTALAAYVEGLRVGANVIVHVDGDGQFFGADIARVALALDGLNVDLVHGVRRGRKDPWFRRTLSALVRCAVFVLCGRSVPDVNTPLRAYRREVLERLVAELPEEVLVPHVHFSITEARDRLRVRYVSVASIPRRSAEAQGTMWGAGRTRRVLPPTRLVRFAARALRELWSLDVLGRSRRGSSFARSGAPMRG